MPRGAKILAESRPCTETNLTLSARKAVPPPFRFRGMGTSMRCRTIVVCCVIKHIFATPETWSMSYIDDWLLEFDTHLLHK